MDEAEPADRETGFGQAGRQNRNPTVSLHRHALKAETLTARKKPGFQSVFLPEEDNLCA